MILGATLSDERVGFEGNQVLSVPSLTLTLSRREREPILGNVQG